MWYLFLLILTSGLYADIHMYNTYKGISITPETLPAMLPDVPDYMYAWHQKNKLTMRNIVPYSLHDVGSMRGQRILRRLQVQEFANMESKDIGGLNNVFRVEETENTFFVKCSRIDLRIVSMNIKQGPKKKTYLTAYQAAQYLVLQELIKEKKLRYLRVPWTSLIFLSPRKQSVDDDSCFCVQEHIVGDPACIRALSLDVINECLIFCEAGVWDWAGRNLLHTADGFYYFIDLGPPRECISDSFFAKDQWEYLNNVCEGFNSFIDIDGKSEYLRFVVDWLEKSEIAQYVLNLSVKNIPGNRNREQVSSIYRFRDKIAVAKRLLV